MRKIEQLMLAAINSGKAFKLDNTEVTPRAKTFEAYTCEVLLHGHKIATLIFDSITAKRPHSMTYSACGYNTRTTRSRLNVLFKEYGKHPHDGVTTRKESMTRTHGNVSHPMESCATYYYIMHDDHAPHFSKC